MNIKLGCLSITFNEPDLISELRADIAILEACLVHSDALLRCADGRGGEYRRRAHEAEAKANWLWQHALALEEQVKLLLFPEVLVGEAERAKDGKL